MNRVEELIQQLCPKGVEWKKLGEITRILRGRRLTKSELLDKGDFPVFHGGIEPLGYYNSYNRECDTVMIINVGASAGTIGYSEKNFWSSDGCFCIEQIEQIKSKFLYYFLIGKESFLASKVRKAGIPTLDSLVIENILVPIPPLPIQQEIVRILDTFTELNTNLQTELEARKKQYAYYRDCLLNFEGVKGVEWKKLGEVCNIYDGVHQTPKYQESGIPFISVENINNIYGSKKYISQEAFDAFKIKPQIGDLFLTRIGVIGVCGIFNRQEDIAYYVSLALLRPDKEKIITAYLKYIIESNIGKKELRKYTLINAVPIKINKSDIAKIEIPIPPLSEQRRIVSILDQFETLVNDLSIGLPAELEARRKQYEYYRDKLLTFDRV